MRRSQSLSSSSSGLRCFAALARASRLASRASLNWFLRRLLISRPFRRSNRGPCALSHGRPSSTSPRNLGYGISYAGACLPAPCGRCRISPWPLRCSFRSNVHQSCRLLLMVACQRLQGPAEPFGLRCVVEMPLEARHLPAFLFMCFRTLLPQVTVLLRVFLASAPLYHGVQFLLDHLAACYVHLSSLPVMAHGVAFPR